MMANRAINNRQKLTYRQAAVLSPAQVPKEKVKAAKKRKGQAGRRGPFPSDPRPAS
jgi:hypothetical protein